ncbi:hypothetical protein Vretimale_4683 [Volvox reticuliferus]|uniref:Uncharacterized protein n=1 Tax=Volvox reticuliferus TaxID=1737510 RepID=A0A8J4G4F0_9CHLO|nr:hypothetical protein Vretimale_4683 [Volvox reticuliferus]
MDSNPLSNGLRSMNTIFIPPQARVMGTFAAHSMLGRADELASGFNFELFTHVTRFLGAKVVFLGLYNGQRLGHEPVQDIQLFSRVAQAVDGSGSTFVRVLMLRGRMQVKACARVWLASVPHPDLMLSTFAGRRTDWGNRIRGGER